jgi:hypothetical protein
VLFERKWNLLYFDGYWQDCKYVDWVFNNIGSIYTPIDKIPSGLQKYIQYTKNNEVISLHIRRGDYLKKENIRLLGICSLGYYKQAVNLILSQKPSAKILVISDDNEWVKDNLHLESEYTLVEDLGIKPYWYIYLMSCCKYNIMSNSTFSWWGAFLNQDTEQMVVAPLHWMKAKKNPPLYNDKWILIDNWI